MSEKVFERVIRIKDDTQIGKLPELTKSIELLGDFVEDTGEKSSRFGKIFEKIYNATPMGIRANMAALKEERVELKKQESQYKKQGDAGKEQLEGIREALAANGEEMDQLNMKQKKAIAGYILIGTTALKMFRWIMSVTPAINHSMKVMNFHFRTIGRELGKTLAPAFKWAAEKIKEFSDWFINLPQPIKDASAIFIAVAAALFVIAGAVLAVTLAASPMVLIVLAVIAVITAIILVIKNWGVISDWFVMIWKNMVAGLMDFGSMLGEFFSGIWDGIKLGWEHMVAGITNIGEHMVAGLKDFGKNIGDFFVGVWNGLVLGLSSFGSILYNFFAGDFFVGIWDGLLTEANEIYNSIIDVFSSIGTFFTETIPSFFSGIGEAIASAFSHAIKVTGAWLTRLLGNIFVGLSQIGIFKLYEMDGIRADLALSMVGNYLKTRADDMESAAIGSGGLPRDMILQAHEGEIIVPAAASADVRAGRAMIGARGSAGGGRGGITINNTIYITESIDAQRTMQELTRKMLDEVKRQTAWN